MLYEVITDKIGRGATLTIMLLFQAVLMFTAIPVVSGSGSSCSTRQSYNFV